MKIVSNVTYIKMFLEVTTHCGTEAGNKTNLYLNIVSGKSVW